MMPHGKKGRGSVAALCMRRKHPKKGHSLPMVTFLHNLLTRPDLSEAGGWADLRLRLPCLSLIGWLCNSGPVT